MGANTDPFLARLSGFFARLRDRGLPVGIGAELDLGHALTKIDASDRDAFLDACRATLAKSPADLAILDSVFAQYWSRMEERNPQKHEAPVPSSPPADGASTPQAAERPPPLTIDTAGIIAIGRYSPEAPPGAHSLRALPAGRVGALRAGARRFRRLAATRPGRRTSAARHGRIDLRATARRGLSWGGEWIELRRRERKSLRSDLFILWDVSGSMREHDPDLFALVLALYGISRRSRVFAFGSRLAELTSHLQGKPYARARLAVARILPVAGGGTRIGRSLHEFRLRFGSCVTSRGTVVILSDGWDLGDAALLGRELSLLRRRAHLVAWVNPYARRETFRPDTAGMQAALPHVDLLLAPEDFEAHSPRLSGSWSPGG